MRDWVRNERSPGLRARAAILSSIAVLAGCGGNDIDETDAGQGTETFAEAADDRDESAATAPAATDDTDPEPGGTTASTEAPEPDESVAVPDTTTEASEPDDTTTTEASATDDAAAAAVVVVEENWFNSQDAFGTPLVHWIGVIENAGPDSVEIGMEVAALDASGSELGSSDSQFPWAVRPGGRVPFALTIVNLPAEAESVRSEPRVGTIPDFRAERVGVADFTGDVVDIVADDEEATVTVVIENVGDVEARPNLIVTLTDDGASLVGAGIDFAPLLCPGETAEVTTVVSFGTPPEGLDTSLLSAEAYFPDDELYDPQPC